MYLLLISWCPSFFCPLLLSWILLSAEQWREKSPERKISVAQDLPAPHLPSPSLKENCHSVLDKKKGEAGLWYNWADKRWKKTSFFALWAFCWNPTLWGRGGRRREEERTLFKLHSGEVNRCHQEKGLFYIHQVDHFVSILHFKKLTVTTGYGMQIKFILCKGVWME